jgi:hypothetical protein
MAAKNSSGGCPSRNDPPSRSMVPIAFAKIPANKGRHPGSWGRSPYRPREIGRLPAGRCDIRPLLHIPDCFSKNTPRHHLPGWRFAAKLFDTGWRWPFRKEFLSGAKEKILTPWAAIAAKMQLANAGPEVCRIRGLGAVQNLAAVSPTTGKSRYRLTPKNRRNKTFE